MSVVSYRLSLLLLWKTSIRYSSTRRSRVVIVYHIRVHDVVYMYIGLLTGRRGRDSGRGCHWRRPTVIISIRVVKLTGRVGISSRGVMNVLSDIFVFYAIHLEHLHSWRVGLELLSGAEIAEFFWPTQWWSSCWARTAGALRALDSHGKSARCWIGDNNWQHVDSIINRNLIENSLTSSSENYIRFVLHFGIENKGRKRFVVSKPEIAFFVCRGYFHHTLGWQRGFWVCQLPKDFKVLDKEFAILRLVCSIKKRAERVFHQKIETFNIAKNQQKIRKNFWHFSLLLFMRFLS